LLSEVWWDDVLPWPQQSKLRHHGWAWFYYFWSYARSERVRAIFYTVMHANKNRMMNKNLNPFFRRFLVFEILLFMICYCSSLFS
jgi:hypothetical protein